MGDVPVHLGYFEGSMFEMVEQVAVQFPNRIAFAFMGKSMTCGIYLLRSLRSGAGVCKTEEEYKRCGE